MARPAWDVKEARETAGLRQVALARSLSLPDYTFDRIERSLITAGSTATADAIIAALPTLPARAQFELRSLLRRKQSHWIGLRIPATANNALSTPATPANTVLGDLDVRVKFRVTDWDAVGKSPIGTWGNGGNHGWYLLNNGPSHRMQFSLSADGTAATLNKLSSIAHPFVGITSGWAIWRVTVDLDNGAGGSDTTFWSSVDNGQTYQQVGAVQTQAGAIASIFPSTTALAVAASSGTFADQWQGDYQWAEVRNGINGPVVARFDAQQVAVSGVRTPTTTPVLPINLFTLNEYGVESSLPATFVGEGATATATWDNTTGYEGTSSVLLTAATPAAGRASIQPNPGGLSPARFVTTPGQAYTFVAHSKAVGATHSCKVKLNWLNALNAFILNNSGAGLTNSLAAWTTHVCTFTAPAGGVGVNVGCDMNTAVPGDMSNWDGFAFFAGTELDSRPPGDVWTMNGSGWSWVEVAA